MLGVLLFPHSIVAFRLQSVAIQTVKSVEFLEWNTAAPVDQEEEGLEHPVGRTLLEVVVVVVEVDLKVALVVEDLYFEVVIVVAVVVMD